MLPDTLKHLPDYTVSIHTDPTPHIANQAPPGVSPDVLMQDFHVVAKCGDSLVLAVGDMANNGPGTPLYKDPELAASVGLPIDYKFNGGLIGSLVLHRLISEVALTGNPLVVAANKEIQKAYVKLGIIEDPENVNGIDPANRFTGYIGHALVGPDVTQLTSIEDVYIYVNGELVQGADKTTEYHKQNLIDGIARAMISTDPHGTTEQILAAYATRVGLPDEIFQQTLGAIKSSLEVTTAEQRSRQTAYTCVDACISPWQIRFLQNSTTHTQSYSAIDGTVTSSNGVYMNTLPTSDIGTIVLSTDGMQPATSKTKVYSATDLVPVNPEYGEQTVVSVNFQH